MERRKESFSKTGYGVGFASRQHRFNQTPLAGIIKSPNPLLELIYSRASSSPGPGHYEVEAAGNEIGGKVHQDK